MQKTKTGLAVFLSLPLLALMLLFDIIKLPVLLVFVFPLWGLLDIIATLRGEEAVLPKAALPMAFMGMDMWWVGVLGMPEPDWLNPLR